jgi:arylsulfatase A-like enzyme
MVGEFLNSLDKKILNSTIILIFSEHGEMFAKHGRFGRAGTIRGTLYDDVVHIPLIIKTPKRQTKKVRGLVQIIDIMPTILDILDIPFSQEIQGKSLVPLINRNKSVNEYVYAGLEFNINRPRPHPFYPNQSINESIRDHKWKLIREVKFPNPNENKQIEETFELYDLQQDPDELTNLADEFPDITKDLKKKLSQWVKWSKEFITVQPSTKEVSEELLRDAREHGYW